MRESKFRGLTEQGEWRYGDFITDTREFNRTCDRAYILPHWEKLNCPISVRPETVGQYTGLKDKNGKEIFEGDIIKSPVDVNTNLHGNYAYYEVLYRNGLWIIEYVSSEKGFILPRGYLAGELIDYAEQMRKSLVFEENAISLKNIEVIGNIYQNPELLEVAG